VSAGDGRSRRRGAAVLLSLALIAAGSACDDERPASRTAGQAPTQAVVVASFNFTESRLVAEIYAQALESRGIPVQRELELGPRELVLPALHEGMIDIVPEYLGSAATALGPQPSVTHRDRGETLSALRLDLRPWHATALEPAPAQDQNGYVVTRETARRLSLVTLSDLRQHADRMTFTGPAECPTRTYCLAGLERTYGLHFARFLPFDGEDQRASALSEGVADVAVMFSTDGRLATGGFVLLADDQRLQPPENVVPVVTDRAIARYGDQLTATLNAVSTQLTSANLTLLNWRTGIAHRDLAAEAYGWLHRHALLPTSSAVPMRASP
jgi:osmoprotectant transport system substrate-binding protein